MLVMNAVCDIAIVASKDNEASKSQVPNALQGPPPPPAPSPQGTAESATAFQLRPAGLFSLQLEAHGNSGQVRAHAGLHGDYASHRLHEKTGDSGNGFQKLRHYRYEQDSRSTSSVHPTRCT